MQDPKHTTILAAERPLILFLSREILIVYHMILLIRMKADYREEKPVSPYGIWSLSCKGFEQHEPEQLKTRAEGD